MGIGGKNRISYSSKVSILQTGRDNFPDLPDLGSDSRIAVEIPVEFSTKGIRKRCVTLRAQTTVVEFLVEFCLAPSHKLRMALATQPKIFFHCGEELRAGLFAKLSTEPCLVMVL